MIVLRFLDVVTLLVPPEYEYAQRFRFSQDVPPAVLNGGGRDDGVGHAGDDEDVEKVANGVCVNGKSTVNREDKGNDAAPAVQTAAASVETVTAAVTKGREGRRTRFCR